MMLADRLKKSVEEILRMTTLELNLWAGYLLHEHQRNNKTMGNSPIHKPTMPNRHRRRR